MCEYKSPVMKHSCKGVGRCKRSPGYRGSTLGGVSRGDRERQGEELPSPRAGILRPRTVPGPFMAWQPHRLTLQLQGVLGAAGAARTDGQLQNILCLLRLKLKGFPSSFQSRPVGQQLHGQGPCSPLLSLGAFVLLLFTS